MAVGPLVGGETTGSIVDGLLVGLLLEGTAVGVDVTSGMPVGLVVGSKVTGADDGLVVGVGRSDGGLVSLSVGGADGVVGDFVGSSVSAFVGELVGGLMGGIVGAMLMSPPPGGMAYSQKAFKWSFGCNPPPARAEARLATRTIVQEETSFMVNIRNY